MHIPIIQDASTTTSVLLLHVPYPGKLKFHGMPSSLLHAVSVFAHRLAREGQLEQLGIFDPGTADASYRDKLASLLRAPDLRVLCLSSSSAASEELAYAVDLARALRGDDLFILVGGPHEDDCEQKVADRVPGVDLSIAGDAEEVLDFVLATFLALAETPQHFVAALPAELAKHQLRGGRVTLTGASSGTTTLLLPSLTPRDLATPVWTNKRVAFSVFDTPETLPIMVTRGCPYGRCSFCAEPNRESFLLRDEFEWIRDLAAMRPHAAIYLQDSILPAGALVEGKLLPLLASLGRPWGCQVYLRTLTQAFLQQLARAGCSYIYTGLETASPSILAEIGKTHLNTSLALERLRWARDLGVQVGVSLMFGAMANDGRVLETARTVDSTVLLAESIVAADVPVAGFYPNIMTVLPGTQLARGLARAGIAIDYYRMPRSEVFQDFEDGSVGYNFTTIPGLPGSATAKGDLGRHILDAATHIQNLGVHAW